MNSSKSKKELCRICLEHKASLNWSDEIFDFSGVSYKDCYFKYTQIEETDEDFYPTNLCSKCAIEVRNAHTLFEKALTSFIILQNSVKGNGYKPVFTSYNGSKEIHYQPFACDEFNIAESHQNEQVDLEIDEVICYSPVDDDSTIDTELDKDTQGFESPFGLPFKKQAKESFDNKLLMATVDKKEENKKKIHGSLNTAIELKLQLEICGSKLLKSSTKSRKSLLQTTLKKGQTKDFEPMVKILSNTNVIKLQHTDQKFSKNTLLDNIESQQSSPTKSFENDEQKYNPLNNVNFSDSDTNSLKSFYPKRVKKNRVQKSFCTNDSEKEEEFNKQSDRNCLEENNAENDISFAASSNTTCSISKESHILPLTKKSIEKKKNTFKPSEISLLEKIYGKNFDIKCLKKVSEAKWKICQYCSFRVLAANLLRHEATHLKHRERNIICPKCGIRLYTKHVLNEHMKTHVENRQRQHKCEFCEKAFFHKGALNVHRRIHLGLMVKCQMCPREFYRQVDLQRHLLTHSASPLQNSTAEKEKNVTIQKYTIQCQYCDKAVRTTVWRAHKAAHLNEPQSKCKICDKDFFSRHSCYRHIKQTHRKAGSEIEENIYSYVDWSRRTSHLILEQQESLTPLIP